MTPVLRVATRGSALARWQAERVIDRLGGDGELVIITTAGDRDRETPIHTLGGRGVFVSEVQDAVLEGRADIAVHSAKDLPPLTPPGLVLAAVPERADPRDALVGGTLETLPTGARVGTGSVRRRAQLAHHRPDLTFGELRGNVPTRLARLDRFDAVVIAAAALDRLNLVDDRVHRVDPATLLPQVAQGALGVECRVDDSVRIGVLGAIEDVEVRRAVDAERAFLAELGGGCDVPVGALAHVGPAGVTIDALLASLDGRVVLRTTVSGDDPVRIGVLGAIEDVEVRRAVDAERAFLAELGGGCDLPVGALAHVGPDGVTIDALLASLDGRVVLRTTARGEDPEATGRAAARRLVDEHGGRLVLEDLA